MYYMTKDLFDADFVDEDVYYNYSTKKYLWHSTLNNKWYIGNSVGPQIQYRILQWRWDDNAEEYYILSTDSWQTSYMYEKMVNGRATWNRYTNYDIYPISIHYDTDVDKWVYSRGSVTIFTELNNPSYPKKGPQQRKITTNNPIYHDGDPSYPTTGWFSRQEFLEEVRIYENMRVWEVWDYLLSPTTDIVGGGDWQPYGINTNPMNTSTPYNYDKKDLEWDEDEHLDYFTLQTQWLFPNSESVDRTGEYSDGTVVGWKKLNSTLSALDFYELSDLYGTKNVYKSFDEIYFIWWDEVNAKYVCSTLVGELTEDYWESATIIGTYTYGGPNTLSNFDTALDSYTDNSIFTSDRKDTMLIADSSLQYNTMEILTLYNNHIRPTLIRVEKFRDNDWFLHGIYDYYINTMLVNNNGQSPISLEQILSKMLYNVWKKSLFFFYQTYGFTNHIIEKDEAPDVLQIKYAQRAVEKAGITDFVYGEPYQQLNYDGVIEFCNKINTLLDDSNTTTGFGYNQCSLNTIYTPYAEGVNTYASVIGSNYDASSNHFQYEMRPDYNGDYWGTNDKSNRVTYSMVASKWTQLFGRISENKTWRNTASNPIWDNHSLGFTDLRATYQADNSTTSRDYWRMWVNLQRFHLWNLSEYNVIVKVYAYGHINNKWVARRLPSGAYEYEEVIDEDITYTTPILIDTVPMVPFDIKIVKATALENLIPSSPPNSLWGDQLENWTYYYKAFLLWEWDNS